MIYFQFGQRLSDAAEPGQATRQMVPATAEAVVVDSAVQGRVYTRPPAVVRRIDRPRDYMHDRPHDRVARRAHPQGPVAPQPPIWIPSMKRNCS